jgi:hypothetical protein
VTGGAKLIDFGTTLPSAVEGWSGSGMRSACLSVAGVEHPRAASSLE